jgi:hypothetical protein
METQEQKMKITEQVLLDLGFIKDRDAFLLMAEANVSIKRYGKDKDELWTITFQFLPQPESATQYISTVEEILHLCFRFAMRAGRQELQEELKDLLSIE